MPARTVDDDPLALIMAPPPNETPEERSIRLQREEDARRISEAIDESLKRERQEQRRRKTVKLLLLGQSESGAPSVNLFDWLEVHQLLGWVTREVNNIKT